MLKEKAANPFFILILLAAAVIPSVTAVETGGYVVQPAYELYPEYSDLYFTVRSPDTVLLNDPEPSPVPVFDLPLWILVVLGIGAAAPGVIHMGKHIPVTGLPVIGGFSRLKRNNILDNTSREIIYRCIKENPGVQIADLNKLTGLTYRNLIYHLNILVNMGMITSGECKNTTRYFENSGKFSYEERAMLMHLNHRRDRKIIETVLRNPGISRHEISRLVGISGPTVSWHMHFLIHDNIIEKEKEGTVVRHYLSDKMLRVYDDVSRQVCIST